MITITDPRIDSYILGLAPEEDPFLDAMEVRARETGVPIIDRQVGRLIHLVTRKKKPDLVVELGSGFGYSSYWFARALGHQGRVVLTDFSERHIDYARKTFNEAGLSERAEFRVGDALRIGAEYDNVDMLFIDVDKYMYPEAISVMLPKLADNALIIADNALWHGTVVEEDPQYENSGAIRQFNEFMFSRRDFFTTIVPLRDGVLLAYKLS